MSYVDVFHFPDWQFLALSAFQTGTIFCLILAGLQVVGRRVFSQRGPQDLIIIVLVAESCDLGLTHEEAGYWGTIISVVTLFFLGYLTERIPFIRRLLNEKPVVVYERGVLYCNAMKKHMLDENDLDEAARENGSSSYKEFDRLMLEGDGNVSAIRFSEPKESK